MKNIIFICHGNICRSPVGEILFNKYVKEMGLENEFHAISRAISNEEYRNDIYPPMKRVLDNHGVNYGRHYATKITLDEYENADYIFYMDRSNYRYLESMFLLDTKKVLHIATFYSGLDIEDPWYTGRFEMVYSEIDECVKSIIEHFKNTLL